MAAHSPILALDIGSHTVKLAEFTSFKDGSITLQRFSSFAMGLDPNKEESRSAAVTRAVRQALNLAGIRGGKVHFSIAGHSVFMRGVKLPAVDAMQLDQMITFEAQQIVPFPLAEVVWDFLVLPSRAASSEKEAIIVAIKSDLLESEYAAVQAAGVEPAEVDVGPLALYNAYRYNYAPVDHCILLIDIGARSTNLLFIEGDRLYTRILPLAGNTISQTICNEFQEPFSVAETLKIETAGVHLGGNYAGPSTAEGMRLWKLTRNVMGRIQTEINRSIIFYRNQQSGSSPQQILLTGGSSRLPYLDYFLSEKFGIPVEIFNPLRNVNIHAGVDRASLSLAAHSLGEVVGLALRASGPAPAEIRLQPLSIAAREQAQGQRPWIYAALVCWLLLFVVVAAGFWMQLQVAQKTAAALHARVQTLSATGEKMSPLESGNDALNEKFKDAQRLITQRDTWSRLLNDINSKVPQGVWITQLTPTSGGNSLDSEGSGGAGGGGAGRPPGVGGARGGAASSGPGGQLGASQITQLQIKGMFEDGLQPEIVNRFVSSLAETGWFDLDASKVANAILSTDTPQPNSGQLAWNYTLSLKLKEPISLAP